MIIPISIDHDIMSNIFDDVLGRLIRLATKASQRYQTNFTSYYLKKKKNTNY
jgi:hypothetical protein